MKILFMGTPDFAGEALKALLHSRHLVAGVVTQPDKPRGRGHKLTPPEVKVIALENNIPVYQPETLKNGVFQSVLDDLRPDILVVAAYGKILPPYMLDYAKYGCINIHASILPNYRGAAPIQWAVINGDQETGITIMQMDQGLDTGDILAVKKTQIGEYETAEQLFDRLAVIGGELLLETLEIIEQGRTTPIPQGDIYTYAPMIAKKDAEIDWQKDAAVVSKLICGMNSWPLAYTHYNGATVKIIEARKDSGEKTGAIPGQILAYDKEKGLQVQCGSGSIWIQTAQFEGTKKMSIHDYIRGHELQIGAVLGK